MAPLPPCPSLHTPPLPPPPFWGGARHVLSMPSLSSHSPRKVDPGWARGPDPAPPPPPPHNQAQSPLYILPRFVRAVYELVCTPHARRCTCLGINTLFAELPRGRGCWTGVGRGHHGVQAWGSWAGWKDRSLGLFAPAGEASTLCSELYMPGG